VVRLVDQAGYVDAVEAGFRAHRRRVICGRRHLPDGLFHERAPRFSTMLPKVLVWLR
jgi:hypothetical protein